MIFVCVCPWGSDAPLCLLFYHSARPHACQKEAGQRKTHTLQENMEITLTTYLTARINPTAAALNRHHYVTSFTGSWSGWEMLICYRV